MPQKDSPHMSGERRFFSPVQRLIVSEVLILVAIAACVGIAMALHAQKPEVQEKQIELSKLNVDVFETEALDFQQVLTGFGTARADREVLLAAQVTGEIIEVHAELKVGADVSSLNDANASADSTAPETADVLLKIDPRDFQQRLDQSTNRIAEADTEIARLKVQQSNLERQREKAQLVLKTLTEELERVQRAMTRKAASASDLSRSTLEVRRYEDTMIQLENQVASIPLQIQAAEQRLATAKSEKDRAINDLARTETVPPFDGVLSEVLVEQGQYVRAGEPLVRLTDLSQVEIPISLGFDDFLQLESALVAGTQPTARLAENETSQARWEGTVVRASPEADSVSRTVQVYVEVTNQGQAAALLPGAFVHCRIDGKVYRQQILVPREAIVDGRVFVVNESGMAQPRQIESGLRLQSLVVVESGLEPGERIVVTNLDIVQEGGEVAVQNIRNASDEIAALHSPEIRLLSPVPVTP